MPNNKRKVLKGSMNHFEVICNDCGEHQLEYNKFTRCPICDSEDIKIREFNNTGQVMTSIEPVRVVADGFIMFCDTGVYSEEEDDNPTCALEQGDYCPDSAHECCITCERKRRCIRRCPRLTDLTLLREVSNHAIIPQKL